MKNLIQNIKWAITCYLIDCKSDFNDSVMGKYMKGKNGKKFNN